MPILTFLPSLHLNLHSVDLRFMGCEWGCQDLRLLFKGVTAPTSRKRGRDWQTPEVVWAPLIRLGMNKLPDLHSPCQPGPWQPKGLLLPSDVLPCPALLGGLRWFWSDGRHLWPGERTSFLGLCSFSPCPRALCFLHEAP